MRITSFRDMDTTEDFEFVEEKMGEYFRWGIADFYSLQQATYWIGDLLRKELCCTKGINVLTTGS